jgi:uncharacterized membrane protein
MVLIILFVLMTIFFYPKLPDKMPVHFNLKGQTDNFAGKSNFVLITISMFIGLYLLATFIPFIDPFRKKIENKYSNLLIIRDVVLGFSFITQIILIYGGIKGNVPVWMITSLIGVMFIFIGNYLPRVPRNFFFGIKTPWTIASEYVWKKTHILGGWAFVLCGLIIIFGTFLNVGMEIIFLCIVLPVLLASCFIYPYLIFRKEQKNNKKDEVIK